MRIDPIKISGSWTVGWALDVHTISSEYVGEDPFGNPRFNTRRSEIGELVYQLKYQLNHEALSQIVDVLSDFLCKEGILSKVDIILPAPPSKNRQFQPVLAIAEAVAHKNNVYYSDDVLTKTSMEQSKGMTLDEKLLLRNSVNFVKRVTRPCNVLLIDDIYQTGSTLNECVRALREDDNIKDIFVVTMTKTAKGG